MLQTTKSLSLCGRLATRLGRLGIDTRSVCCCNPCASTSSGATRANCAAHSLDSGLEDWQVHNHEGMVVVYPICVHCCASKHCHLLAFRSKTTLFNYGTLWSRSIRVGGYCDTWIHNGFRSFARLSWGIFMMHFFRFIRGFAFMTFGSRSAPVMGRSLHVLLLMRSCGILALICCRGVLRW